MDESSDELVILATQKKHQRKRRSPDVHPVGAGTSSPKSTGKRRKSQHVPGKMRDAILPAQVQSPHSVSTGDAQLKDAKYIVRFKMGDFERDYYMNDDDPLESIYENLFGNDTERRIFYEGTKLSRLLSAGESGFFPGINYIYLPKDDTRSLLPKASAVIKFDENTENDLVVALEPGDVLGSILKRVGDRGVDLAKKCLIYNGIVLDEQTVIDSLARDGGVIDVVNTDSVS